MVTGEEAKQRCHAPVLGVLARRTPAFSWSRKRYVGAVGALNPAFRIFRFLDYLESSTLDPRTFSRSSHYPGGQSVIAGVQFRQGRLDFPTAVRKINSGVYHDNILSFVEFRRCTNHPRIHHDLDSLDRCAPLGIRRPTSRYNRLAALQRGLARTVDRVNKSHNPCFGKLTMQPEVRDDTKSRRFDNAVRRSLSAKRACVSAPPVVVLPVERCDRLCRLERSDAPSIIASGLALAAT